MTEPLLEAEGIRLALPDLAAPPGFGPRPVVEILKGVSFRIGRGERVGIVGESGSGKSSLGRVLLRLHRPTAGTLRLGGQEIGGLSDRALLPVRRRLQMIFQDPQSSLNPRHRIGRILTDPLRLHGLATSAAEAEAAAAALLHRVGLDAALLRRYPHELSGGQRQRVGIARAVALRPDFVLADEVVSGLDVSSQARVLALLRELTDELGLALAFISHDLSVVRSLCARVYVMRAGEVVEEGPTAALFVRPRSPYTQELVDAIPLPVPDPDWLDGPGRARGMKVAGSVALVTGANRGIGRAFVEGLIAAGARKVYATARDPAKLPVLAGGATQLVPLRLDVTKPGDIAAAATAARDVTLLINNAGINTKNRSLEPRDPGAARAEMETNYFGPLALAQAFAPVIRSNGGGAIVNNLSVLANFALPAYGSLCASKAAMLMATQGMRAELAGRGVQVLAVMPGAADTDMEKGSPMPLMPPAEVVRETFEALERGDWEVFPGDMAKGMRAGLLADPLAFQKDMAKYL
jgi:peptide/nickel transport system ATP-binding protein